MKAPKSGSFDSKVGILAQKCHYLLKKGHRGYQSFLGVFGQRIVARPALMPRIGGNCHTVALGDRGKACMAVAVSSAPKKWFDPTGFVARLMPNKNLAGAP